VAIPWMWVLKTVPWSEVIANAPKLVDGARKLWSNVGKQATAPRGPDAGVRTAPASMSADVALARLEERIGGLENNLAEIAI